MNKDAGLYNFSFRSSSFGRLAIVSSESLRLGAAVGGTWLIEPAVGRSVRV